jgi:hypothetical protein
VESGHAGYTGTEAPVLVPQLVDEATQARYYTELIDIAACDSSVESLLFFDFLDEVQLERFQSGQIFADGAKKESYGAIQAKLRSEGGRCTRHQATWRPSGQVIGAQTIARTPAVVPRTNRYWAFSASTTEDVAYKAWIADSKKRKVANAVGSIDAYYTPLVRFPAKRLAVGCYSYGLTLTPAMNPERATTVTVAKFKVGVGVSCTAKAKAKPKKAKPKPKK